MAFDPSNVQYLEDEEWRLLTAIEIGQRNHELVATELVQSISGIRGTCHHFLGSLLRARLIRHEGKPYDGYQLTKNGYDYLALHALTKRGTITHLSALLGQGKEADVYSAFDENETPLVVKFHRVGRVSFRKAKETRDYLNKKHSSSWLYLSRLSAKQEFNNMTALQDRFKGQIPVPIDWNRHAVVMSLVPGTLMNNLQELSDPAGVFDQCIDLAVRLLKAGIVHADFSQYNTIVSEDEKVTLIDFPQCMPFDHVNAMETFHHDLDELRRFFELRFGLHVEKLPQYSEFVTEIDPIDLSGKKKNTTEEEEEDENEDKRIRSKVSKENRYKKKPKRKNEIKSMSKLKKEAAHIAKWE